MLVQLTESAGWWIGDDNSQGVEISIAGGVRKMVRDPTPKGFFFSFFFFFFYHAFIVFRYKKLRKALAMEKTKPINPKLNAKNQTSQSSANLERRQNNRLGLINKSKYREVIKA